MRDNADNPGTDLDPGTPGYQTQVPVITWDPVPGASSYEADVAPYESGLCNWSAQPGDHHWRVNTAVNAWTPLGESWNGVKPYSDPLAVAHEFISLVPGTYCARVRARTDRDTNNQDVYGDYTYLDDGTGRGTAFEFTGYWPPGGNGCNSGYLCADDYLTPVRGVTTTRTPYFTWRPLDGAQSYFVLVAKDPNFTTIVDYGFTHIPAYAPRTATGMRTYTDEATSYYWAVLPAQQFDGGLAVGNPLLAAAADFNKQSVAPSLLYPSAGQVFADQPSFRWTPAEGARRYRLQVATDDSFSNLLDDVTTDATSYSSNTTYPPDTVLYWRVRADDENLTGLTWSAVGTFQKTLPAPVPSDQNPTYGDMLPVWAWSYVQGASSYDISIDQPNGQNRYFSGIRVPVVTFIKMTGIGIFHWRVRAEFPESGSGETPGPWSATQSFTRTIGEPANAQTDSAPDHVLLSWNPKVGIKTYKVQVSSDPSFGGTVETATTDNPSFAPTMTSYAWGSGGTFYWRVAGVDEDRNQGDWSQAQTIQLLPTMRLSATGTPRRRRLSRVGAYLVDGRGQRLAGVRIRVSGAGIRARVAVTNSSGRVTFRVKPRRRGFLTFTATKPGYQSATARLRVR
jgi:hypothetical protein